VTSYDLQKLNCYEKKKLAKRDPFYFGQIVSKFLHQSHISYKGTSLVFTKDVETCQVCLKISSFYGNG